MMNINKKRFFLSVLCLIMGIFSSSAATVTLEIPPGISRGQMFNINVIIDPKGEYVAGAQLDLEFNKSNMSLNSITEGNFLKQSGFSTYFLSGTINNSTGKATNISGVILGKGNVTTSGVFIIINATSIGSINSADINLKNINVVDLKQINPVPTSKPTIQTETVNSVSGDAPGGGGTGGATVETTIKATVEGTVEALPVPENSNKTIFIAAFAGILIISIFVYKYVIPKYSASKGVVPNIGKQSNVVPDIGKQNNVVPDIGKQDNVVPDIGKQNNVVHDIGKQNNVVQDIGKEEKIIERTRKKLSSIIRAEASDGNIKNIASDTKKSESSIKKVRAPRSKNIETGPIPTKKNSRKKKETEKKTGKPTA